MKNFIPIFVISLLLINIKSISQNFEIKPVPNWVSDIANDTESKVSKYDINSGFYTSLIDVQVNFVEDAEFTHVQLEVVSNTGVNSASQIYISYDTSYQNLEFHYLYVWRDGKRIDRTDELTFEILKNEQNLGNGIYTGLINAYDILSDIRRDDRIEYAYTILGSNPIYQGNVFRLFSFESVNPIDKMYVKLLGAKNQEYFVDCKGCEKNDLKENKDGEFNEIIFLKRNIKAAEFEKTTPTWHLNYDYFVVSSFKSWAEVNDWAMEIFKLDNVPDFTEVKNELNLDNLKIEEKIDAVIDFVQDDIRYMGIESGIGSIKPFHPDEVLMQRFGDCKDKSLLLTELLKSIGIENAFPALVNSSLQNGIEDLLPSGQIFDHCITYFEYKGKSYWVDPTMQLQGGSFKEISNSDYGKALVVRSNNKALNDMIVVHENSKVEVVEELNVESFDKPGSLKVVTYLKGMNADYMRNILEYYSIKEVSDKSKNAYGVLYPNIKELERIKIDDDEKNNVLTITEHYEIDNFWEVDNSNSFFTKKIIQYEPMSLYDFVNIQTCEEKKYPVFFNYPANFEQTTSIQLPRDLNVKTDEIKVENNNFSFQKHTSSEDKRNIKIIYKFISKSKEVPADEFIETCQEMNKIVNDLAVQIYFTDFVKK